MKAEVGWNMDRSGVSRKRNCFGKNRWDGRRGGSGRQPMDLPTDGWMFPRCRWSEDGSQRGKMASGAQQAGCEAAEWESLPWNQHAALTCCESSLRPKAACLAESSLTLCSGLSAVLNSARSHTAPLPPAGSFLKCRAHLEARFCLTSSRLETKKRGIEKALNKAKRFPSLTTLLQTYLHPWEVLGCMGEQKVMKWMVNLSWCQLSSNFEWNLPFSSRNSFTFSLETTERILLLFPGTEVFWYPKKLSGQTLRGCSLHLKDFNQRIVLWPQLWPFKLGAVPSRKGWQDWGC